MIKLYKNAQIFSDSLEEQDINSKFYFYKNGLIVCNNLTEESTENIKLYKDGTLICDSFIENVE